MRSRNISIWSQLSPIRLLCSKQLKSFKDPTEFHAHAPGIRFVMHPVRGGARMVFPLSEANRRCKPRHVLQRPPENNTCLHTVGSHNALPRSELVPFRLAFSYTHRRRHHYRDSGIRFFFCPSSSLLIASCIRHIVTRETHRAC